MISYRYVFERIDTGSIEDAGEFQGFLKNHFRPEVRFGGYIIQSNQQTLSGSPKVCWQALCEDRPTFRITNTELHENNFSIQGYYVHVYGKKNTGANELKIISFDETGE